MSRVLSLVAMALMLVAFILLGVIAPGADPDLQLDITGITVVLLGVALALNIGAVTVDRDDR